MPRRTRRSPRVQPGEQGRGGVEPRHDVGERGADLGRRAPRRARDRHQPRARLGEEVEGGRVGERARRGRTAHRDPDDVVELLAERLEAERGELVREEVLDDRVRGPRERRHRRVPLGRGEVDGDRAPVAVDREVVGRVVAERRRRERADAVAGARSLDLDDVGAEVRDHEHAQRASEDLREVEHPNALERQPRVLRGGVRRPRRSLGDARHEASRAGGQGTGDDGTPLLDRDGSSGRRRPAGPSSMVPSYHVPCGRGR